VNREHSVEATRRSTDDIKKVMNPLESPGTALIRRFIEQVWNHGDVSHIDDFVHPDYMVDGTTVGNDWVTQNVASLRRSFPDLHFSVLTMLEQENQVAGLLRMTGTHRAEWRGIPATGKTIDCREAAFWRIDDGLIVSGAFIAEALTMRIQLGLLPPSVWHGQAGTNAH